MAIVLPRSSFDVGQFAWWKPDSSNFTAVPAGFEIQHRDTPRPRR